MAVYKTGSRGDEVRKIQTQLHSLGLYHGPLDGEFGGGTEGAVRAFQKSKGLDVDGDVGPITWKALFAAAIPEPAIAAQPLDYRCLALTGAFETGRGIPECFAGISGDFDGQGISFGVCQWNFGQDSLQPLLDEMLKKHRKIAQTTFQDRLPVLAAALQSDKEDLMDFARSIQHPVSHVVYEPWRGMFKTLGRTREFQQIEQKYAAGYYRSALGLAADFGLSSARAAALMFDIIVQNGSIKPIVKAQIERDFAALPPNLAGDELELEKMKIVANRRAEAAKPQWIEDVRARKLCIAKGGGVVHGIRYDLEAQFGIGLQRLS